MTLRLLATVIVFFIVSTPAHAYLLGPSCDDRATISAFIAEAQCTLLSCREEPLNRSVGEIKSLSAAELDAILLEKAKARVKGQVGELTPAVTQYGAFLRKFAVETYVHMSRLDLAVSRISEISHHQTTLTCAAEMTFNVAEAREALYNGISAKVYSLADNAGMLLEALEDGDSHILDKAVAANRPTWLAKIDLKLHSPRNIIFVASQGPKGPIISLPKALLMD
jgi:hypothetical protein